MSVYHRIFFNENDVIGIDDWIPVGEHNPHKVRPWLIHCNNIAVCVVFATSAHAALSKAADSGKLDRFRNVPDDIEAAVFRNIGELFDLRALTVTELPNPKRLGFCDSFDAHIPS